MTQVTINGNIYSDAGESAKDMRSGGFRQHLLPMINDVAIVANNVQLNANDAGNAASSAQNAANEAAVSASLATEIALGAIFPKIRPSLLLDFANSQRVDPRITFTRNSTAMRFNHNGVLEIVPANIPRIDYDPVTGECLGLLIEEQRTNLLTYSDNFNNAAWGKFQTSINANAAIAPDGTLTASKLIESTATSEHRLRQVSAFTALLPYTESFFVKAGERHRGALQFRTASSGLYANFNLIEKTINTPGTWGTDFVALSSSIQELSDGWFRVSLTGYATTSVNADIVVAVIGGSGSYEGDGVSGLYIWCAQLEMGYFHTSCIHTDSVSVTRSGDKASMEGINFSSWYIQEQGTFVIDFEWLFNNGPVGSSRRLIEANNGTSSEFMAITSVSGSATQPIQAFIIHGGVQQMNTIYQGDFGKLKACLTYKKDDAQFAVNGSALAQDTSFEAPDPTQLYIGRQYNNVNEGNFHLSRLAYYPKRLTESELVGLSTL